MPAIATIFILIGVEKGLEGQDMLKFVQKLLFEALDIKIT